MTTLIIAIVFTLIAGLFGLIAVTGDGDGGRLAESYALICVWPAMFFGFIALGFWAWHIWG